MVRSKEFQDKIIGFGNNKFFVKSDIRHHRQQKATFEICYELRITFVNTKYTFFYQLPIKSKRKYIFQIISQSENGSTSVCYQ